MGSDLVSVIMAVYKEPKKYILDAVNSIRFQTYNNIELLLINDNPNRDLESLLDLDILGDARVKIIVNQENLGLAKSLNRGIELCNGKYIARMDADDISMPERIENQLMYLTKNQYDLVGAFIYKIDEDGNNVGFSKLPVPIKKLKLLFCYSTIAFHPTWLGKKEVFKNVMYNEDFKVAQDYEFLSESLIRGVKISNCPDMLLKYRLSSSSLSFSESYLQFCYHLIVSNFYSDNISLRDGDVNYILDSYLSKSSEKKWYEYGVESLLAFNMKKTPLYFLKFCIGVVNSKILRIRVKKIILSKILIKYFMISDCN